MKNPTGQPGKDLSRDFTTKERSDIRILMRFVEIYCREKHSQEKNLFTFKLVDIKSIRKKELFLCQECTTFLRYCLTMRLKCPYDPKPMCKKCSRQCYKNDYKLKIREIMKFSGMYLVKRGRLDMLYHYLR
jgi:Nitrous oxide-stimulated promoter